MVIDVRKLNAQKKYVGHLEFEHEAPETLLDIPLVKFSSPVKVEVDYEIYEDDSVDVRGSVSYRLEGQCSRCLKEASQEVKGELEAYFQPCKNAEDYSYFGGVIDLTQAVHEAIMTSLPFLLSCGDDCVALSYTDKTDDEN